MNHLSKLLLAAKNEIEMKLKIKSCFINSRFNTNIMRVILVSVVWRKCDAISVTSIHFNC